MQGSNVSAMLCMHMSQLALWAFFCFPFQQMAHDIVDHDKLSCADHHTVKGLKELNVTIIRQRIISSCSIRHKQCHHHTNLWTSVGPLGQDNA